jgi:hypothetical protein
VALFLQVGVALSKIQTKNCDHDITLRGFSVSQKDQPVDDFRSPDPDTPPWYLLTTLEPPFSGNSMLYNAQFAGRTGGPRFSDHELEPK